MKINFVVTELFKSGGMRVIFEYANRLFDSGHDVILYYPIIPYKFKKDNLVINLKRFYWSAIAFLNQNHILKNLYPYKFKIKGVFCISNVFIRDADFIFATAWPTAYSVIKLSEKKGKKIYLIQDYENWNSDIDRVDNSYKLNMHRITVSTYLKDYFKRRFNVDSNVILNGINYNIFNCENRTCHKEKTITIVEHALAKKGINNAIEILKRLNTNYKDVKFICFGYDKYHNIPDFVQFYANPDDITIAEIYNRTDIFLFTSINEGFGLPPAEAMACKCAVVTTNVGAIPEYSTHMESAIHVNPHDVDDIYKAVIYLLDNDDEIKRISENGYNKIRETLSWEKAIDELKKILIL